MFGKVSGYMQRGMRAAKGGIALAHRVYSHGLEAAGRMDTMYKQAKKIGNIVAPHLEMYGGGKALTDAARSGAAGLDQMRSQAITRHADVSDRIADHGRALTAVRQEIPRNFLGE